MVTKFQVSSGGDLIGGQCDTLPEAVLEAASHDGWGAKFARLNEDGDEDPAQPMRLFSSQSHLGNNPYFPRFKDRFSAESDLADDDAAIADVAQQVAQRGVLHSKYSNLEIRALTYNEGGQLTHVDGSSIYETAAKENGTVTFDGREFSLTEQADYTSRLLPGGYTNYNDAAEGEAYDFEMSASAIDRDGNKYTVYWLFEGRKGEDDNELDSYDYSEADRVVEQ